MTDPEVIDNPYLSKPVPPRMWRLPVPERIAALPEGEKVAEACRLAAGGMPALQAARACGLAWARALLDGAVALGHAGCLVRLHQIRECAGEAYRYYDALGWRETGDQDARAPELPPSWTERAGAPLSPAWGWLGLVYAYQQEPVIMATLRPAFLEASSDELSGADPDAAALLEAAEDAEAPPRVLQYTPVSVQTLRKRPSPDADLLPGLARARGFLVTGYDCAGASFRFEPTGVRPPLVERGHESQVARAARKDALTTTRHPKTGVAQRWHRERIAFLLEQFPASWDDEDDQRHEDRPGYPFWDGRPVNLAGAKNDSLYEQWEPRLQRQASPDVTKRQAAAVAARQAAPVEGFIRGPSLGQMRHALIDGRPEAERYHQFAKPTPLALWWMVTLFVRGGGDLEGRLRHHDTTDLLTPEAHAFLLDVWRYWDGEGLHLSEVKALVLRHARAEGVPEWPTPEAMGRAAMRADCYAEDFNFAAYRRWAFAEITAYVKEQLEGLPPTHAAAALEVLWYYGLSGRHLDDAERLRASNGLHDLPRLRAEAPLIQYLFTPSPGKGQAYFVKGKEPWALRPSRRTKLPAINGPAEERGEEAALNQLDQFAAAVRHGKLGAHLTTMLAFSGTLSNFLEGALGKATTTGRGTANRLLLDGQETTLLDLVRAEQWRAWQAQHRPDRKVTATNSTLPLQYAYLADPRVLYTELAPALLWVHQVCFAQITGRSFRLYVTKADLARARHRGFITDDAKVDEILAAGALGRITDQAFRSYPADDVGYCPDWVRKPWTPARLTALANGAYGIAQRARDGLPVSPSAFRAMAQAMGYPESAVQRGLARLGQGLPVASIPGFGHLDADYRAEETSLDPTPHLRRGLLGRAWRVGLTFNDVVRRLAGFVPPERSPTTTGQYLDRDPEDVL